MIQKSNRVRFSIIALLVLMLAGAASYYYWIFSRPGEVVDYDADRDRSSLEAIFHQNWYWLDVRPHSEAFDSFKEHLNKVDMGAPDAMWWKVYREHGMTTGFVAFYMLSPGRGKVLFLAVDHVHRARGQANALMNSAMNELKLRGAKVVELVTKVNNYRAQNLYNKLGFKVVKVEEGHFYFEYYV